MVISLLLVFALSVVGVALLISPPSAATANDVGSLLRLDPSTVRSIRVAPIDAQSDARPSSVIDRTDAGGWTIRLERDGAPLTAPWPAQPTQVRAMIRTLCDLRDASSGDAEPLQGFVPALEVTITLTDGSSRTVRFDATPLGGLRLIEIGALRTGRVDDQIYRALTSPGPASWRVRSPLASVGERTSRIALRAPGQGAGVELARLDGRWYLRQPIQSRAANDAANALLGAVGSLTIERFIDDAGITDAEAGLDAPRLTCRVEEDHRSVNPDDGQVRTTTRSQTLVIGGPADLSGKLVYAAIRNEDSSNGGALVVLNIEPIATVSLKGETYLAPTAAETIKPNIGALAVRVAGQPEARYERGIQGWSLLDATGATIGETPAGPIVALLTALTETPATALSIEAPDSYRPIASITLFDFGGGPMESIEAGAIQSGALVLRSGQVFRVYEGADTPALLTPDARR